MTVLWGGQEKQLTKYSVTIFGTFIICFWLMITGSRAEQIGVSWEFNQENDSEGWTILFGVSDLQVSDGTLKMTASL